MKDIDYRQLASDLMKNQNHYSEDICHYYSKGIQSYVVYLENTIGEHDTACTWTNRRQVSTGERRYIVGCNKKKFADLHEFEYCPYCGKEIEVKWIAD